MPDTPAPLDPVELPAGGFRLRPWHEDDAGAYWAALESPGGRLWHGSDLATPDDVAAAVARRRNWSTGDHASWALVDGSELLGSVALFHLDRHEGEAEIGYWVAPAHRGRGLAVLAAEAACHWGFAELGLHRVQLFHAVENTASARVAQKAGFTREGRLRQSHRYGDGLRHDELLWALLATD